MVLAVLSSACRKAPTETLQAARAAMQRAGEAGGVTRAPEICTVAHAAMALAEAEVRLEQKRWFLSRDPGEAERLVARAHLAAERCALHAIAARDRARERADRELGDLESWIGRAAGLARHAPETEGIQGMLLQAEISLGEGRGSMAREQYERASDAAERGREQVADAVATLGRFFDDYLESPKRATWRRWVAETLQESRHERVPVILIDKLRRQLLVMRGREEVASYAVDLGAHGMDSKTRAGDAATPEGRYRVTEVRGPGRTRYYRALMLDYPNDDDRRRFRELRRTGLVTRRQEIGSLIEIHGQGGRGQDWTLGCVALQNDDMDDLMQSVGFGTPVTIVGTIPEGTLP